MTELRIEKEVVLKYPTQVHALLISLAGSENKYCHSILIGSKRLQCSRQQALAKTFIETIWKLKPILNGVGRGPLKHDPADLLARSSPKTKMNFGALVSSQIISLSGNMF